MKRIVVCYDGTWNAVTKPNEVTNVVRVGQAVKAADEKGVAQVVFSWPFSVIVGSPNVRSTLIADENGATLMTLASAPPRSWW